MPRVIVIYRWGCKLSQKLFVGKDYVLKHIKLKHTEKMEEHRSKVCLQSHFGIGKLSLGLQKCKCASRCYALLIKISHWKMPRSQNFYYKAHLDLR